LNIFFIPKSLIVSHNLLALPNYSATLQSFHYRQDFVTQNIKKEIKYP